jgi:hypothetical protein
LKEHGLEPAPERERKTAQKEFLCRHARHIIGRVIHLAAHDPKHRIRAIARDDVSPMFFHPGDTHLNDIHIRVVERVRIRFAGINRPLEDPAITGSGLRRLCRNSRKHNQKEYESAFHLSSS